MVNSRAKGAAGEREVASILRGRGYAARRGQQFAGGPDSPDVVGLPGFHVEVKRTERLDLYGALGQATKDSGQYEIPVVLHRRNNRHWVAVLDMDDFLDMVEAMHR